MFYEKYIWRSICLQSLNSQLLYRQMGMNQIQCYKFSTIDCFMWWILSIIAIKVKTLKLNSEANVPIRSLSVCIRFECRNFRRMKRQSERGEWTRGLNTAKSALGSDWLLQICWSDTELWLVDTKTRVWQRWKFKVMDSHCPDLYYPLFCLSGVLAKILVESKDNQLYIIIKILF